MQTARIPYLDHSIATVAAMFSSAARAADEWAIIGIPRRGLNPRKHTKPRRFLYVRYGNGREELYDYAEDRWELTDVHGRALYRDRKAAFRRRARARCDPPPPGFTWR